MAPTYAAISVYPFQEKLSTVWEIHTYADVSSVDVVMSNARDRADESLPWPRTMQPAAVISSLLWVPVNAGTTWFGNTRVLTCGHVARRGVLHAANHETFFKFVPDYDRLLAFRIYTPVILLLKNITLTPIAQNCRANCRLVAFCSRVGFNVPPNTL